MLMGKCDLDLIGIGGRLLVVARWCVFHPGSTLMQCDTASPITNDRAGQFDRQISSAGKFPESGLAGLGFSPGPAWNSHRRDRECKP